MLDAAPRTRRYSIQPRVREHPGCMGRTGWDSNPRHGALTPCARFAVGSLWPLSHLSCLRFPDRSALPSGGAGRSAFPPPMSLVAYAVAKSQGKQKSTQPGILPRAVCGATSSRRSEIHFVLIHRPTSRLNLPTLVMRKDPLYHATALKRLSALCNRRKGTLPPVSAPFTSP